jgi:hypothetical protein
MASKAPERARTAPWSGQAEGKGDRSLLRTPLAASTASGAGVPASTPFFFAGGRKGSPTAPPRPPGCKAEE